MILTFYRASVPLDRKSREPWTFLFFSPLSLG